MREARSMDFFAHQDRARRNTRRLIALFCAGVAGIVLALYLLSRIVLFVARCYGERLCTMEWWDPAAFAGVAVGVAVFVGMLSLVRIISLRSGGHAVAGLMGGIPVDRMTDDPQRMTLLNVVEEMAIASGVPVPDAYVLESEQSINAFAAGISAEDAVVAVSRGCLDHLSRDELQGVIAHEFSHVLSGDMRLNIHIMGVLYGIFALTIVGRMILRGMRRSRGKGAAAIALAGVGLLAVGSIGTLVGRLIQSAVCRQREFLADASAVQFTRNPRGIAGALMKIGGLAGGSILRSPSAEQASHLFIAQGVKIRFFSRLLASHPPLSERIRRIDPAFEGSFPSLEGPAAEIVADDSLRADMQGLLARLDSAREAYVRPAQILQSVGNPDERSLALASQLIGMIPSGLKRAAADRSEAPCLAYAMLLSAEDASREQQMERLSRLIGPPDVARVRAFFVELRALDAKLILPLFELAVPSLRARDRGECERFASRAHALVSADERVTLFEFMLEWMIENRVTATPRKSERLVYTRFAQVARDADVLLAALAAAGSGGKPHAARSAFSRARSTLSELAGMEPAVDVSREMPSGELKRALNRLRMASFAVKREIVNACAHCAVSDDRITVREGELLRVISLALGCPIPPLAVAKSIP